MSIRDPEAAIDLIREKMGPSELARAIKIKSQAVSQWKRVPAERVLEVERATGISRHTLRPDLYGPAPDTTVAA